MKFDFEHKVKKDEEELLIKGLLKRERGVSTRLMRRMRYGDGGIFMNGEPAKLIDKVKAGDFVQVKFPVERSNFTPEDIPIDVIYEDDSLLAVNKQPGFVVHPTKGHPDHTIANGVMKHMIDKGDDYKIRFINRLDMDTSGLLLIGKNPHVQNHFTNQGSRGEIKKKYRAVLCGVMDTESGVIDLPIGKEHDEGVKRIVRKDGLESITEYHVLKRFSQPYTLVEAALITGRTHQIRVHFSYLGHPVVGDELYGGSKPWLIARQALHASYLSFTHPMTGKKLELEAPLPEDIKKLMTELENR